MGYENILTALADSTRRAVLNRLRDGPQPVGRIAEGLPVTRPAVSQHLKVCLEAGLVRMNRQGTRNLYSLAPDGAADLIDWLATLRSDETPSQDEVGRDTRLTQQEAWSLFWDDLTVWWPVAVVSLSARQEGALPMSVSFDPRAGGALTETFFDGRQGVWAQVSDLKAPAHVRLDWSLGLAESVEIRFQSALGGARVSVQHSGAQPEMWEAVLDRFAAAANSSLSNF